MVGTPQGSPQGGSVSPLLANIYLHYVLDLWADWWRRRVAHGDVIIVRFTDNFVMGFEVPGCVPVPARPARAVREVRAGAAPRQDAADRVRAVRRREPEKRGAGKPETFDFLGFTHICAKMRDGRFSVRRITVSKRVRAKLAEVKDQLRRRQHLPVPEQGRSAGQRGARALRLLRRAGQPQGGRGVRTQVTRHWHQALQRRGQRPRLDWKRMDRLATRWLPPARVVHPFPDVRFGVRTRGRSPVR